MCSVLVATVMEVCLNGTTGRESITTRAKNNLEIIQEEYMKELRTFKDEKQKF